MPYYYCSAAVCCLSLPSFLFLLLCFCFCLYMFACACWCTRSSYRCGARSPVQDAAHRRQQCCSIIEDKACSGFNLHLTAFCSWVERWGDDGESYAVPLCCAVLCCACAAVRVACLCFHRGHQKRCLIARKCSRILRTNNNI